MNAWMAQLIGYPIYIATQEYQRRKHHKKRINKKWQKRYGFYEINMMPHGQVVMMDNGVVWMTKRTFNELKEKKESGKVRELIGKMKDRIRENAG